MRNFTLFLLFFLVSPIVNSIDFGFGTLRFMQEKGINIDVFNEYNQALLDKFKNPQNFSAKNYPNVSQEGRLSENALEYFAHNLFDSNNKRTFKNPNCEADNVLYDEVITHFAKRKYKAELTQLLRRDGYEIINLHKDPYCFRPLERQETDEERITRRLQRAESIHQLSQSALEGMTLENPLDEEKRIWKPFFDYFKGRKLEIDAGNGAKINRGEIEDIFEQLISENYTALTLGVNTFYYKSGFIPKNITDPEGRSLAQRLDANLAPIGFDGNPMNIHHLTRHQPGYFVLISESMHKSSSKELHFRDAKHYVQPEPVERSEFQRIKEKQIFPKLRFDLHTKEGLVFQNQSFSSKRDISEIGAIDSVSPKRHRESEEELGPMSEEEEESENFLSWDN